MTRNFDWLGRLNRDSKGIWGVSNQLYSKRGGSCVSSSSPSTCEMEDVYIVKNEQGTQFQTSDGTILEKDLRVIADKALLSATDFQRTFVRIVVHHFHLASIEEQCSFIKNSRSIQEESRSTNFQFVFCGEWSYQAFCKNYKVLHGQTSSPAAEGKNILYVPQRNRKEVIDLLLSMRIISQPVTDLQNIACDLLIESTSGNEFLIEKAIEYLADRDDDFINNVEQVIDELINAPEIIEYVKQGITLLNEESKEELGKLLQVHRLIRSKDSATTEQLWLVGLVKFNPLIGNKHQVQIAGPIINTVLRNISESVGLKPYALAKDLCFGSNVVSAEVYRKVAEIENILRCLVVSCWYEELGEDWHSKLEKVKTPAHSKEENEELINLVLKCMKNEFPQLQTTEPLTTDKVENNPQAASRNRKPPDTILASALDWQRRQNAHHGVELGKNNIMHFLTTESLKSVITYRHSGMTGKENIFAQKDHLITTLDEYLAIRSAVAHNQPILMVTLSRLDVLLRKITDWTSNFIDQK